MPTLSNITALDFELCEEAMTVHSNEVETRIIDLKITKSASCAFAIVGGRICYTVTIETNTAIENVTFRDTLANELEYIAGSFEVNGTPHTPTIVGNEIQYTFNLPAGTTVITFCAIVTSLPTGA